MGAAARKILGKTDVVGAQEVGASPPAKPAGPGPGISAAPASLADTGKRPLPLVSAADRPAPKLTTAFAGDASDIIRTMRSGIPAEVIPRLAARVGISQDGLFQMLRLPKSTMKARISKNDMLSASEQDRLYRTEKVLTRALAVLEDEESAKAWVVRGNRSLGGEAPLSLLDTEVGYELVLDTLGRIEYGIVS
jgi:putative toxin-antitoxin system antitoxin component (TIGR02293 family)